MARLETSHGQLIGLALDSSSPVDRRADAVSALALFDDELVLRAFVALAQDESVPAPLRTASGRSLAQYCYRRLTDVDELVLADMTTEAFEAYDGEIARLLTLNPGSEMKRGEIGSGR